MPEGTFSPAVLIVDDDIAVTDYLRERFLEETSVGVLVANHLDTAREILDDDRLQFDALISDLHFEAAYEDPAHGLSNGIDILAYGKTRRPSTQRFVFSIWAERDRERLDAERRQLDISSWMHKMFYDPEKPLRTPWAQVERNLIAQQITRDGAFAQRASDLGLSDPGDMQGVSEFARALRLPIRTFVQHLPDSRYELKQPIEVLCTRDEAGGCMCRSLRLGLLVDGVGDSILDAISNFGEGLLDQWELLNEHETAQQKNLTLLLKERLSHHIAAMNGEPEETSETS